MTPHILLLMNLNSNAVFANNYNYIVDNLNSVAQPKIRHKKA